MIRILSRTETDGLLARRAAHLADAEQTVAPIIEAVRRRGDAALLEYARKLDGFQGHDIRVPRSEMVDALGQLPETFLSAFWKARRNIRLYARRQVPKEFFVKFPDGHRVGQVVRPLDSMAAYVPAGRYPLPSTLLMTVIPAQVAGVRRTCVASPRPSAEILGAAALLNVDDVFRMGGAQAIAAFAFGTETVPKVDRITGPGNIYVAAAKKLLAGEVGIDFVAGPTEVVIVAGEGDPRIIAADMLAQAEHDVEASAILITTSRSLAEAVALEIERQLETLPTAPVARESISKHSAIILITALEEAVGIVNHLAPEHLNLPDKSLLRGIRNAGSIFIGPHSPEAAGDYASGPNHVLPTSGAARLRGGLSAADFVKVISIQEMTPQSLKKLEPVITTLARVEGLEAHARSVEVRTRG